MCFWNMREKSFFSGISKKEKKKHLLIQRKKKKRKIVCYTCLYAEATIVDVVIIFVAATRNTNRKRNLFPLKII